MNMPKPHIPTLVVVFVLILVILFVYHLAHKH